MYAPQIDSYVERLGRVPYREVGNDFTYDDSTYQIINEIFARIQRIEPNQFFHRELWVRANRGEIDAFGNYNELYESGEVESEEEFKDIWTSYYPEESVWYRLILSEDPKSGYRAIFIGNKMIIEDDPRKPKRSYPHDISEFASWILSAVTQAISELEAGTYNDSLEKDLPYQCRTGTILRKDFYRVFPEYKIDDLGGLSTFEIYEFIKTASEEKPKNRLKAMTANDFYSFCSVGYQANGYDTAEKTPKEQYELFADGRDGGLSEIDPNSTEAFWAWYNGDLRLGTHPWEVCRGGNSTHIDLYVFHDDEGYYLLLRGSSMVRFVETIKFYLALHRMGIPVALYDAGLLKQRVTGDELIGIVPYFLLPVYCSSWFPGKNIIDFMNLPEENREELAKLCCWEKIDKVRFSKSETP